MFSAFRRIGRRPARGFSLIELGIVIAVIAVLASVVIFGRGFISAGRVSKTIEGLNTIRKAGSAYAGLLGGTLRNAGNGNLFEKLAKRSLLPVKETDNEWLVAGDDTNPFKVTAIHFGMHGQKNAVAIKLTTPGDTATEDVFTSLKNDSNLITDSAQVAGQACAATPPASNNVTICFDL